MLWYIIVAIAFTLLGGAGGYLWGAQVFAKAKAVANAVK